VTYSRWLQCVTAFPGDCTIQDKFDLLFMAERKPRECALFCRTTKDFTSEIFLLTPGAGKYAKLLPGDWDDAGDPREYGWTLLVGHAGAHEDFGLSIPDRSG